MPEEKKLAGASYILSFYNDIENLTGYAAQYLNIYKSIKGKYTEETLKDVGMEETDQQNIVTITQAIRACIFRIYIKITSLKEKVNEFGGEDYNKLKASYGTLIEKDIYERAELEDFIILLNKLFITGVFGELLVTAKDVIDSLVNQEVR